MRLLTELRGLALHAIHQKGKAVIYQNTGDGNVQQSQQPLGAGCSQQSGSATLTPELEQVANTVTQRIVPELKDQIVQAIELSRRLLPPVQLPTQSRIYQLFRRLLYPVQLPTQSRIYQVVTPTITI
jgi:hypothetical protein